MHRLCFGGTKLKLAILLHGHMRSYEQTNFSFKRVVGNLKKKFELCDIFIHTWDMKEPESKTWHSGPPLGFQNDKIKEKEIRQLYNPVDILVESQEIKYPKLLLHGTCYEAVKHVWYSMYMANELKKKQEDKNNFKYDIVVKLRPDIEFFDDFLLEELEANDKIWHCQQFTKRTASDVVFFANSKNMDLIAEYYKNFDRLSYTKGVNSTESIFNYYLDNLGVPTCVSKFVMPRDWRICRSWWEPGHRVGHRKWDPELAAKDIKLKKRFEYFRRNDDQS